MDYTITAKAVSQSASRASGLIIAKCKSVGGVPFEVFTKLYETIAWPVHSKLWRSTTTPTVITPAIVTTPAIYLLGCSQR